MWWVKTRRAMSTEDFEKWVEGEVVPVLNVFDNATSTRAVVVVKDDLVLRRLTPLECERLQGFPDAWTAGQSNSQRYKQMGNAVTVPVAEYMGFLISSAFADEPVD